LAAYAELSLVHGDIKQLNILVDNRRAMLFDNSVSCAEGTPGRRGTEGWMAPEVDAGGLSTHKSDMWSLGKLLARMLSLVVRNVI